MSDIDRQGTHISNTIVAITHKEDFPKSISKELVVFRSFSYNEKFDVISDVITSFEHYCFELANKGMEFNLPSIGKFKIKTGTALWDEITTEFAKEHGYESYDDVPSEIVNAHYPELDRKIKQTFFDRRLAEKLTKREQQRVELLAKRLEGM